MMLYNKTAYCTTGTKVQSVRWQHRKWNSKKSEIVTYKDDTQVARIMGVSFI